MLPGSVQLAMDDDDDDGSDEPPSCADVTDDGGGCCRVSCELAEGFFFGIWRDARY